jgi:hypothetical protein
MIIFFKIDMPPLTMEGWASEKDVDGHGTRTTSRVYTIYFIQTTYKSIFNAKLISKSIWQNKVHD